MNVVTLKNIYKKQQLTGYILSFRIYTVKRPFMNNTKTIIAAFILLATVVTWFSCNKPANVNEPPGPYKLSYGDSILYLKQQAGDYIVSPTEHRDGIYTAFPEGIEIDDVTGAINVSKSETGLRYRITHTATDGTVTKTMVVLSGMTFPDHFFHLSLHDSIAFPVYNASPARTLPVNGSIFDEGNGANSGGCSVKTINGQINLAETVRNGVFGNTPTNDVRKEFDIVYRLNDQSGKASNKIRVRLYYYNTMADVATDLLQTIQDREDLGVFLRGATTQTINSSMKAAREAKPRPPCIIIVGQ